MKNKDIIVIISTAALSIVIIVIRAHFKTKKILANKDQLITEWTELNGPIGNQLGYPDCCIKAFCQNAPEILKVRPRTRMDKIRHKAAHINGEWSGFVPCYNHAVKVLSGEITLESLIDSNKRDKSLKKFPDENFTEEIKFQ